MEKYNQVRKIQRKKQIESVRSFTMELLLGRLHIQQCASYN